MGKTRTLRGTCIDQEVRRLIMDDGNFTKAYKVIDFQIVSIDPDNVSNDAWGTLALDQDGARVWRLDDNRQIGWSGQRIDGGNNSVASVMSLVDPDHVVVRDLFVYGQSQSGLGYQYYVRLEKVDITDDEAILALIKERSQDDL